MTAEKIKHGKDPYEPTPEGFHIRVENTLRSLQKKENAAVPRIPVRRAVVLAALLLTLAGAAYAGSRLGRAGFSDNPHLERPCGGRRAAGHYTGFPR